MAQREVIIGPVIINYNNNYLTSEPFKLVWRSFSVFTLCGLIRKVELLIFKGNEFSVPVRDVQN